jgi:hypothetical protein
MTREDAVSLTSRIVALYFLCWSAVNLAGIPGSVWGYVYSRQMFASAHASGLMAASAHGADIQVINLVMSFVRVVVALLLALWFYRGGVKVRQFLLPGLDTSVAGD